MYNIYLYLIYLCNCAVFQHFFFCFDKNSKSNLFGMCSKLKSKKKLKKKDVK